MSREDVWRGRVDSAAEPHLESGETIQAVAGGVMGPPKWIAFLPGVAIIFLSTVVRELNGGPRTLWYVLLPGLAMGGSFALWQYVIGKPVHAVVTDRRLLLLRSRMSGRPGDTLLGVYPRTGLRFVSWHPGWFGQSGRLVLDGPGGRIGLDLFGRVPLDRIVSALRTSAN